ncbi:MAG: signal transduction histidine kinase with CheB and CheR [Bacteroidota bacterium]|nr:signal transduction histidine kinase with CheB and CheR [Bacteroidota bacterium]
MSKKTIPEVSVQDFPVVGIGASAGGLDAFKRFLQEIPEKSGMAYVIVQHLNPAHESILPELLTRVTKIPVHVIENDINLAPDNIYIIPENKILTASDGVLKLNSNDPANKKNMSIDIFFKSLAEVHTNLAVGVVLSGTAFDGTAGLKAIKENGGLTFAQDDSAAFDSMPQSAINSDVVDFILPPEKIPAKILEINNIYKPEKQQDGKSNLSSEDERDLKIILTIIRQRTAVDFTYYKQPTIRRRLARRMSIRKVYKFSDYLDILRMDKEEQDALFLDMLIPVTAFFRDSKTFESLSETIYPELLKNAANKESIRVWVAGCSSGEEAYSLAISIHEFFHDKIPNIKIQVFATDISDTVITKARAAIYTANDVHSISSARLQKYFTKTDGMYHVNKQIRNMCIFASHNFLKDPPFSNIDMVSCRNVLIYLDTYLQKKALTNFHYALNENGFLFLGKSETINAAAEYFNPVNKNEKIYSRKQAVSRYMSVTSKKNEEAYAEKNTQLRKEPDHTNDFQKNVDEILLSKFAPPAVIVNEHQEIVHFRGDTGLFLRPSPGKASLNVLKMIRDGLTFELRNALHHVQKKKMPVIKENIPLSNINDYVVTMEVIPVPNIIEQYFLIVFHKIEIPPIERESEMNSAEKIKSDRAKKRIDQLEKELAKTREDIRSISEDQEAYNEELQSANEELLSSSEELQTINEELETSKEELQAGNEELIIVNQELTERQENLGDVSEKLEKLNKQLIIQNETFKQAEESSNQGSYTYNFTTGEFACSDNLYRIMGYEPGEMQCTLKDFYKHVHPKDRGHVKKDAEKVKSIKETVEMRYRLVTKKGQKLYIKGTGRTITQNDELILVGTVQDVTQDTLLNKHLKLREAQLSESQRLGKIGSWEVDFNRNRLVWSDELYRMYGYKRGELKLDLETFGNLVPEDLPRVKEMLEHSRSTGDPFEMEYRRYDKNGHIHNIYSKGSVKKDKTGKVIGLLCISMDLSELRQKEETLRQSNIMLESKNIELERKNIELSSFSYVASHDLQEPLRKIQTFSKRLKEKYTDIPEDMILYLDKIESASERMTALIKDLLDYSRLTNPDKLFVLTDLNDVVKNILNDFELLIEQKNATIKILSDLPELEAVSLQINQLIYNIIGNSLKFSREGIPPELTINCRNLTRDDFSKYPILNPEQAYVEMIFTDNGIGFDQSYAKQIFVIFKRLHERSKYQGTGIGLSLSKKIVEIHGGIIFALSEEGKGAEFHVILPLRQGSHYKAL